MSFPGTSPRPGGGVGGAGGVGAGAGGGDGGQEEEEGERRSFQDHKPRPCFRKAARTPWITSEYFCYQCSIYMFMVMLKNSNNLMRLHISLGSNWPHMYLQRFPLQLMNFLYKYTRNEKKLQPMTNLSL